MLKSPGYHQNLTIQPDDELHELDLLHRILRGKFCLILGLLDDYEHLAQRNRRCLLEAIHEMRRAIDRFEQQTDDESSDSKDEIDPPLSPVASLDDVNERDCCGC